MIFRKKLNDKLDKDKEKEQEIEETDDSDYDLEYIDDDMDCLEDLIEIGRSYEDKYKKEGIKYNIKVKTLSKLVEPLEKLNSLIGLKTVKKQVYELIIYYLQKLDNKNKDMLHTVIEGPPGVGKTELAKILAEFLKVWVYYQKEHLKWLKEMIL